MFIIRYIVQFRENLKILHLGSDSQIYYSHESLLYIIQCLSNTIILQDSGTIVKIKINNIEFCV